MISEAIILFLVLDPLGLIPLLVPLLNGIDRKRQQIIILRESLFAFLILLFFYFCGAMFLKTFSLQQADIKITGGVILAVISVGMIFQKQNTSDKTIVKSDPFLSPIATPLLAGASSISICIASGLKQGYTGLFSILLACLVTTVILFVGISLVSYVPEKILNATSKLFGLLLMMISCNIIFSGISFYLNKGK